tara:strand:- start:1344 stop:2174 length:831 start_codon:yes stop_codon:yes gene_type:complete
MAVFTFKAPIRFVAGTGFTISPNDTDINLSSEVQAVFSIAQDVSPTSTVTFAETTSSVFTVDNNLSLSGTSINNLSTLTGNLTISDNLSNTNNLTINGNLVAEEFISELTESVTIFKSGSTKFGNTSDDNHILSGSLNLSGSLSLGQNISINEISNDTTLSGSNATFTVSENALKTYVDSQTDVRNTYLRKSFVHTGSFVSTATQSFTAITASAPTGMSSTSKEDFIFFMNGAFMETDALNIQQSGSQFLLLINNNSIGYDVANTDELLAFGKFNS